MALGVWLSQGGRIVYEIQGQGSKMCLTPSPGHWFVKELNGVQGGGAVGAGQGEGRGYLPNQVGT